MKAQIDALVGVFTRPRVILRALPTTRFYILSLVVSVCLSWIAADDADLFGQLTSMEMTDGSTISVPFAFLIFVIVAAAGFFIVAYMLTGLLRLLGLKHSSKYVMNVIGYSHAPRLMFVLCVEQLIKLFHANGFELVTRDGPGFWVLLVARAAIMLYCLILLTTALTTVRVEEPAKNKK